MKWIAFFVVSAALWGDPIAAPDLILDGQQVVSPSIGAAVVPDGSFQLFDVCLNDNAADDPGDDQDFNDLCVSALFSPDTTLTVTYVGGVTSALNYIGVLGQLGWVGADSPEQFFTFTPGLETIFVGSVNGVSFYLSGTGRDLNTPVGDYFFAECVLCSGGAVEDVPEPSTFLLIPLGLSGLALHRPLRFAKK